jgi:hypothetical protein
MDAGYLGSKTGLARIFDAARQFRGTGAQQRRTPVRERYRILVKTVRQGSDAAAQAVVDSFEKEDNPNSEATN